MILYGFCIQIGGQLLEAAHWGGCVDEAFSYVNDQLQWHRLKVWDDTAEWEYAELASYEDGPSLLYWLPEADA